MHLSLQDAVLAVGEGEQHARRLAQHLRLGPAEKALGAAVPLCHQPVEVEHDDGVAGRAVQGHALAVGGGACGLLGGREPLAQLLQFGRECGFARGEAGPVGAHGTMPENRDPAPADAAAATAREARPLGNETSETRCLFMRTLSHNRNESANPQNSLGAASPGGAITLAAHRRSV